MNVASSKRANRVVRLLVYGLLFPVSLPVIAYRQRSKGYPLREIFFRPRKHDPEINFKNLQSCLWSPRAGEARDLLDRIRAESRPGSLRHTEASKCLSVWLAATGRYREAADILGTIRRPRRETPRIREALLMRAQALQKAGDHEAALHLLSTLEARGTDWTLVRANSDSSAEAKIARLNALYEGHGIARIGRTDPGSALTIQNLAAERPGRSAPDLGKVSVIFPIYNAGSTIEAAVRSVLDQSYGNIEVLLVDDRSSDATPGALARLASGDRRVRVLRTGRNLGAYGARNLGLDHATGAYVTTHDADDWSHPEKLHRQVSAFGDDPDLVATGSHWVRVDPGFRFTAWELRPDLLRRSFPSFMVRRSVFDEIGTWDPVRISGDAEFMYRVRMRFGDRRIRWIDREVPLGFSLASETSLTHTRATHANSSKHGLRRYYHEVFRHQWRTGSALGPEAQRARLALVPRAMLERDRSPRRYAHRLSGDLRDPAVLREIADLCRSLDGPISLTHVPEVVPGMSASQPFCAEAFAIMAMPNVFVEPELPGGEPDGAIAVRPGTR